MSVIIKTENLQFAYPNEKIKALSGIDLEINQGEFVAILGHNGSGKSTLAKHFNAILLPSGGKCYVDSLDTAIEDNTYDIRQRAEMVFQNPDNQIVAAIVEEDVAFGIENLGIPSEEIRVRVDDALAKVGMTEYAKHSPHRLSGGQKQRVAIAGIVAMRPKVIILDEATAMLDPKGRAEVVKTVKELNQEFGITVILITHFMEEAAECDKVFVVDLGKVLITGAPKEVFSQSDLLKSVGLDVPQPTELLIELKKLGYNVDTSIIKLEEATEHIKKLLIEHSLNGGE